MDLILEEVREAIARDDRREEIKPKRKDLPCSYCSHSRTKHCTAGTMHVPYKEEMKQAGGHIKTHPYPCVSDHCEVALCDCRQYQA